jgi:hypothetical protein
VTIDQFGKREGGRLDRGPPVTDLCARDYQVRFYPGRTDNVCLAGYSRKCQKPESRIQAALKKSANRATLG